LLPAGHARAHGALGQRLGVGPGGVRLPPGRLPADRPGGNAQGRREDLRRAAGDRLPLGARRGEARLPRVHAGDVRRLAAATRPTRILHEQRGGSPNTVRSLRGLAAKAEAEGVRIATGVAVTGIRTGGGAVTAVETDQGVVACEQLVIAAGPWVRDLWAMLG